MDARRGIDPVAVVERAYSLEASDEVWVTELCRALDFTHGASGWGAGIFQANSADDVRILCNFNDCEDLPIDLPETSRLMHPVDRAASFLGPLGLLSFDEVESRTPMTGSKLRQGFTAAGYVDGGFIAARDPAGVGALFARFSRRKLKPASPVERRRTRQLALHIASALRLRISLRSRLQQSLAWSGEAVFDAGGRVHHCEGPATSKDARRALRDAVLHFDRSRTRHARKDGDSALARWTALVQGRWTLVERFEGDGRRFYVAYENQPFVTDPRGLTANEHAVVSRAVDGHASKLIAYELGLSEGAVSRRLRSALHKLGFAAVCDLVYHTALLTSGRSAAYADRLPGLSANLQVICVPEQRAAPEVLSPSEYDVAMLAVRGHSNAAIAVARHVSQRTVDNQLASACSKLAARGRLELAIKLAG